MNGPLFALKSEPRPLREYQFEALQEIFSAINSGETRLVVSLPTGAGKTRMACELHRRALIEGKRSIFVVPLLSLVEQTCHAFEAEGFDHIGVIQGKHFRTDPSAPIQIATAQTLARRDIPQAGLVVIDECHRQFQTILDWMADPDWQQVPFVGFSATPWAKGMGKHWHMLQRPVSIMDLIEGSYLSPFRVLAPPGPDLRGVRTTAGDFNEQDLSRVCDRKEIVGDVILTWLRRAEERPTLCYGIDRNHARHLQERFAEAGVLAEYVDCDTPMFEREEVFTRFQSSETKVICNVATLDIGIDLDVRCIVDARPTKSRIRFVQTIGRGLRPGEGKDYCLILDHAGNHRRLGLVTDLGLDVLDDGEGVRGAERQPVKGEEFDAKLCPECHCVQAPRARECPQCGHKFFAITLVRELDGELVELGSAARGETTIRRDEEAWFRGLLWLQQEALARGKVYKEGWVAANFRARFNHWPDRSWPKIPQQPTVEIRNWVRSRQIAYAKARQRYG